MNENCLTFDENIKILHVVKKQKNSCREITEKIKFGKGQVANAVESETQLIGFYMIETSVMKELNK